MDNTSLRISNAKSWPTSAPENHPQVGGLNVQCCKIQELESIKSKIESLSKTHQIEILKIMKTNSKVIINENKNGVFINLSFLPEDVLADIRKYLHFIHDQEDALMSLETQKKQFKHDYFMDDDNSPYEENHMTHL